MKEKLKSSCPDGFRFENQKVNNKKREFDPVHYEESKLELNIINILPQPRKTFEGIEELAIDIAEKGLISPLLVARFNEKNLQKHLKIVNRLWGINKQPQEIKANDSDQNFYILVAGERRLRAINLLKSEISFDLEKVFPKEKIDVRICDNPSPKDFLFRQASENIHRRPPSWEEAKFYVSLFDILRDENKKYSIGHFARDVGKDRETIKRAVQFCLLPKFIQNAVENKKLIYGVACELARLVENGFKQDEVDYIGYKAMIKKWKVDKCKAEVKRRIEELTSKQGTLEIFTEKDMQKMENDSNKSFMAREFTKGIFEFVHYLDIFNHLDKQGKIPPSKSPFSEKSVAEYYLKLIEKQKKILPHLKKLTPAEKQESEQILNDSESTIKAYLALK